MTLSRSIVLAALLTTLGFAVAGAQSIEVDYILIDRMPQTYVDQHPLNFQDWILPGGACITVAGPGGVGGFAGRLTERLNAVGWNNGPNGVKEWGMGDDLVIGSVSPTWSVETTAREAHSGTWCLHDSPSGMSSSDASATIDASFDLSGVGEATLTFWHHFEGSYSSGGNDMFVEARVGAGSWQNVDTYTYFGGFHGAYIHQTLSLNAFTGNSDVQLRFRINASSGNGWTIDDILFLGDGEVLLKEDFETGTDGWTLAGTWGLIGPVTDTPYISNDAISRDRFGNTLSQVDTDGVVSGVPITLPAGTLEGMGYSWVKASYQGLEDGVMVYNGAMSYVPE